MPRSRRRPRSRSRSPIIHGDPSASIPTYNEDHLPSLLDAISGDPLLLVLDGIQDPQNLGAILRTADCAGVNLVIAPRDRACPLTETAIKVSCGGAEEVPFVQVRKLADTLREFAERGIWMVGTADESAQSIYGARLTGPLALVIGAEGKGVRRLTADHCDALVSIPMQGEVECLNASVATGVCLFEIVRQRLKA